MFVLYAIAVTEVIAKILPLRKPSGERADLHRGCVHRHDSS